MSVLYIVCFDDYIFMLRFMKPKEPCKHLTHQYRADWQRWWNEKGARESKEREPVGLVKLMQLCQAWLTSNQLSFPDHLLYIQPKHLHTHTHTKTHWINMITTTFGCHWSAFVISSTQRALSLASHHSLPTTAYSPQQNWGKWMVIYSNYQWVICPVMKSNILAT